MKYMTWASMLLFLYHMIIIKKYEKPEEKFYIIDPFFEAAKFVDWSIYDLRILMTKPGMSKMLPDQMNIPGQPTPKTLVINLNGTLVHQTYKLGVGVEIYKRPGLTAFLNKMH